jgi:hypothetical protein
VRKSRAFRRFTFLSEAGAAEMAEAAADLKWPQPLPTAQRTSLYEIYVSSRDFIRLLFIDRVNSRNFKILLLLRRVFASAGMKTAL